MVRYISPPARSLLQAHTCTCQQGPPHETQPEAAQKLLLITSVAYQEGLSDLPLAATPDSDGPDGGGLPARPASAFAPVAEAAPPTEWQAGAQATEPQVHTGPEPVGAPPQVRQHLLLHGCMAARLALPSCTLHTM
ncbi:TPA: hypothetical protein ACH3X3_004685 [Trebouxia sp. C0006]